ncbi:MAG TPA: helix-turn-helix transcriptional regulator [Acidimicrobiales bacterium]|nr:helix-turn-helix transcriptional regulator [Acidimicrobiales bacterium]
MTPEELRTLREALGLSQYQLAKRLAIPYQTVWRWERGDYPIEKPTMLRLALERLGEKE